MAIARKPNRNTNAVAPQDADEQAEKFILGADAVVAPPAPTVAPKKRVKEQIMMRMDQAMVEAIDRRAARLGLSRSAWTRMVIAKALENDA